VSGLVGDAWVWVGVGFALLGVEALAPGYVFLGFGLGALLTAALVWLAPGLVATGPLAVLAAFAGLSLGAWLALDRLMGARARRASRRRDINDFISKG
jgi:membrane protein implicated in regulation of membrane protease activity